MLMDARTRRRRMASEANKNASNTSLTVAGISAVSIIFFAITVVYAIRSQGTVPNIFGAVGMILFIAAIICLVLGQSRYKMKNYNAWSRILGLVVPIIAVVLWGLLYLIGLVFAI